MALAAKARLLRAYFYLGMKNCGLKNLILGDNSWMQNCFSFYFYNKICWQKSLQVPGHILADVSDAYARRGFGPLIFLCATKL